MTLPRKPKRGPGENPFLRRYFRLVLFAHDQAGYLINFLDELRPGLSVDADEEILKEFYLLPDGPVLVDLLSPRDMLTSTGQLFFRSWLRGHGIDPDTGHMTLDGLAFFEQCLRGFRNPDGRDTSTHP